MTAQEIQTLIQQGIACQHLEVQGDGRHWFATIVSPDFEGMMRIQRHKKVYATLGQRLQTDELHALSMKTLTPAEWQAQQ